MEFDLEAAEQLVRTDRHLPTKVGTMVAGVFFGLGALALPTAGKAVCLGVGMGLLTAGLLGLIQSGLKE